MKKKNLLALAAAFFFAGSMQAQNPYLPLWEHLPDGEPRVFEDPDCPGKMRAYIIGSHDVKNTDYCGPDIRIWSAPVDDLSAWRDEGAVFTHYVDGQWDTMFAPDLVEVMENGKKVYYLYPHSRGWGRIPMVCKGERPDGPFTPINLTADRRKCVEGSMIDFDPSVFIEPVTKKKDPDYKKGFRAYVYYGFQHSIAAELDQETMYSVRPGTQIHDYFIPSSLKYGVLRDPEGTEYPALYKGQNPGEFNFFEASSIRQIGNKYVMVFSGYSGPDYGLGSTNSALRYAYGDSPLGPWRSGGVLVDSRGVVMNNDGTALTTTNFGHNTHGSLQEINGQWYVFYHRPPRGFGNARQAMVAPVKIECDKKPVAKGGKVRIVAYDPYSPDNEWMAKASNGNVYTGAEVTSEGFQIFGLDPYKFYSGGIACHITDNDAMQDQRDVWNNTQTLTGLKNGTVIGYKYFGFGGLAQDTKGCKAFEGTKAGDNTYLNLFGTYGSDQPFKVRVMLDGPVDNEVWKGKEIACFEIHPEKNGGKGKEFVESVKVPTVEGLTGKHAIYLVVEGPEVKAPEQPRWGRRIEQRYGLFDMLGISFSKGVAEKNGPEIVPQVTIMVDGERLIIPKNAILSTNENGYTQTDHYQVYGRITEKSVLEVSADSPEVYFEKSSINAGRATVKATWRGVTKTFLIN